MIIVVSCESPKERMNDLGSLAFRELEESIDSLFNSKIKVSEPGAAILIAYDGDLILGQGYGLRNLETNAPVSPRTNFRMASISKQFTALSILSLVDKGELRLRDLVINYLPHPIFAEMTIEHLLTHTAGLPDYYDHFDINWDRSIIVENEDVLDWLIMEQEVLFKPGDKYEYSNTAYLVLALIVERISGDEFSDYARENVFRKADMARTSYFNLSDPVDVPERAFCYKKDTTDGTFSKVDGFFLNGVMGDGAVYTSINDFFKYDATLRSRGLFSDEVQKLIFKPSSISSSKNRSWHYTMGWNVKDSAAYHYGGWLGANTYCKRYLDKPLTIAIFMNREDVLFDSDLIHKTDSLANVYVASVL